MNHRSILLNLSLVAACGQLLIASALASGLSEFELQNGLQVILRPVAGAQQAAVVTLFDVGNRHDPPGTSGLAHYIEHLYVTAATEHSPIRTVDELVRDHPLGWNAQTGEDFTVYATVVEPTKLADEIARHADRMGSLKIAPEDLARELPRIDDELTNMYERIPALAAPNLARECVRPTPHNGRRGGRVDELKKITADQLQSRWQQFYKPRNATLVVAGDFNPREVRATIESAFGSLPTGDPPPASTQAEVLAKTTSVQEIASTSAAAPAQAALTFRVPASDSPDFAPLLLLYLRMMNQATNSATFLKAPDTSIQFAILDAPEVLSITTIPRPNESSADVERRLRSVVDKAAAATWQPQEPQLAKQMVAFMLDTAPLPDAALTGNLYGVAFATARRQQLDINGRKLAEAIDRATAADLARVADKYFSTSQGACVLVRWPKPNR